MDDARAQRAAFYRTIWRWHFYAGLFVVPMVLILSITGAAYLFKPQIERWEERSFQNLPTTGQVSSDRQLGAALAAYPGAQFISYRLPDRPGDAVLIHLGLPGKAKAMRDIFISPQGKVIGTMDAEWRIMEIVHDIHGQLLLGKRGSWIVELAASWAIIMILTGLYLWWPRGGGLAGVVWPRLARGTKVLWRDLHAVTGFWVSGLALILLLTGLPWAAVWGSGFKAIRAEMGWVKGKQDWTIGGQAAPDEHADHDHVAMMANPGAGASIHVMPGGHVMAGHAHMSQGMGAITLDAIVKRARLEGLAFPVLIMPPKSGQAATNVWTVKSDSQNRPLRTTIYFDGATGIETGRERFTDRHVIDRVMGYGIAWHEGQLFGWVNQLIGLLTAIMLVLLSVTAFVMWRRRKPIDRLGAPPRAAVLARIGGVAFLILILSLVLPLLGLSLLIMLGLEFLLLRRIPAMARWMGLD